jgi:hypothetical protein
VTATAIATILPGAIYCRAAIIHRDAICLVAMTALAATIVRDVMTGLGLVAMTARDEIRRLQGSIAIR